MTKTNILIIATLVALSGMFFASCTKNTDFEVRGKLSNVSGDYFLAAREVASKREDSLIIDTVKIDAHGKFSFKGAVDTLTVFSLYFNNNTRSTYLLVDKGWQVEVKGDVLYHELISAKGGDINDNLSQFKSENTDILHKRAEILNAIAEKATTDSIRGKGFVDLKNINFELSNIAAEYVNNNPEKIASVMIIDNFFRDESSLPRLDETLRKLQGEARTFPLTFSLRRYSKKVKETAVGTMAPNIELKDIKGVKRTLFEHKGKNVLLSFVASTCEMCNAERTLMVDTYNHLKKEKANIEFVTILLDNEITPLPKTALDSMKWTIMADMGGWAAKSVVSYNVSEFPYNILISPTGEILERNMSIYALEEKLKAKEIATK